MPEVANLFLCLVNRFPMKEIEEAEAVQNKGLKGCIHGRPNSKRQVSLMDVETLLETGRFTGCCERERDDSGPGFSGFGARTAPAYWRQLTGDNVAMRSVLEDGRNPARASGGIARTARLALPRRGERDNSTW